MSTAGFIAAFELRRQQALLELFENKNAYTVETAIEFSADDFDDYQDVISQKDFYRCKYIQRVEGTNRFYLDKKIYERTKKVEAFFLVSLGICVFVILFIILLRMSLLLN